MTKSFLEAIRERRSIYAIGKDSPISDERIQEIVEHTVTYTPSAFNSQTTRIVILLNEHHDELWNLTFDVLRRIIPDAHFEKTKIRLMGFKNGHGTILFFEDQSVVEAFQQNIPLYEGYFPEWSQQTSAMHQLVVWAALESEGLGANLQHFNPLIDEQVKSKFNLPESWQLMAQMPFGTPVSPPGPKVVQPLKDRLKVFN